MGERARSLRWACCVPFACALLCSSAKANAADPAPVPPPLPPLDPVTIQVTAAPPSSQRGVGDFHLRRDLLDASPRQQTSELLSAAPGFFVDHEDGEGLGNDVYLRGFDLEHGSGIEFRAGGVPINIPTHLLGQGYADLNFIIPEVVRSLHVREGVYDPRQGDAAIVGSADVDLGVGERGVLLKASYGSFHQARLVGILAPKEQDEETFAAVALRHTNGFGSGNRASSSISANAQYALDLAGGYHVRFLVTAYDARANLAGVLRQDDIDRGQVSYFDTYPSPYAQNQSTLSSREIAAISLDHVTAGGDKIEGSAWVMMTALRLRQNLTGNLESSALNPAWFGFGDLLQTVNDETAAGAEAHYQLAPIRPTSFLVVRIEPGIGFRAGTTNQSRDLLSPVDLSVWDHRIDAHVNTLDASSYVDVDTRWFGRVKLAGGVRADLLDVSVNDRLAAGASAESLATDHSPEHRNELGVVLSPRGTLGVDVFDWLTPMVSYGEGFRSLDAQHLVSGGTHPYSKVTSEEIGLRAHLPNDRYVATLAFFRTQVGNELVFDAVAGGLQTEGASVRQGMVASVLYRPATWFLGSLSASMDRATYQAATADGNHFVPGVPPFLFRADVTLRHSLGELAGHDVQGRIGSGFTQMSGRHLTDDIVGKPQSIWNLGASARYRSIELGVDAYNLLDLRYPDDEEYYVSNWGGKGVQPPASFARHITAAPPRTMLVSLSATFLRVQLQPLVRLTNANHARFVLAHRSGVRSHGGRCLRKQRQRAGYALGSRRIGRFVRRYCLARRHERDRGSWDGGHVQRGQGRGCRARRGSWWTRCWEQHGCRWTRCRQQPRRGWRRCRYELRRCQRRRGRRQRYRGRERGAGRRFR